MHCFVWLWMQDDVHFPVQLPIVVSSSQLAPATFASSSARRPQIRMSMIHRPQHQENPGMHSSRHHHLDERWTSKWKSKMMICSCPFPYVMTVVVVASIHDVHCVQ